MPHEFDPCEAPVEGEVDKWGFTIKPTTVSYTHLTLPTNREV